MRLRSLLFLPAAALVLTACGGDGSSAEAKPYVDAMVASMTESDDAEIPEDDARCFSEKFIDIVGIDRVKKAGDPDDFASGAGDMDFEDLELTRDEAGKVYDSLGDCGQDPKEQVLAGLDDEDVPAEAKTCVEDLVSDDLMREVVVAELMGDEDNKKAMEFGTGMMQCVMGGMDLELGDDVDLDDLEFEDLDLDSQE